MIAAVGGCESAALLCPLRDFGPKWQLRPRGSAVLQPHWPLLVLAVAPRSLFIKPADHRPLLQELSPGQTPPTCANHKRLKPRISRPANLTAFCEVLQPNRISREEPSRHNMDVCSFGGGASLEWFTWQRRPGARRFTPCGMEGFLRMFDLTILSCCFQQGSATRGERCHNSRAACSRPGFPCSSSLANLSKNILKRNLEFLYFFQKSQQELTQITSTTNDV